jgi:DNA-binding XRE family transcriptional regulator
VFATVRTQGITIRISGAIPSALLEVLRDEYGVDLILRLPAIGHMIDVMHAPLYYRVQRELSPGRYLKVYRQDRNLTQRELGKQLGGIARQNIGGMESGRRPISRKMIQRLADFFEVDADKFLGR